MLNFKILFLKYDVSFIIYIEAYFVSKIFKAKVFKKFLNNTSLLYTIM